MPLDPAGDAGGGSGVGVVVFVLVVVEEIVDVATGGGVEVDVVGDFLFV
jgi:hypothetical protein